MPYLDFEGHRAYYQVSGSGPPLILHHGFGQWAEDWNTAGWTQPLEERARVVVLDALGHGKSDRPHDKTPYLVESRTRLVLQLADELGFDTFAFFGFSMGARAGLEIAASSPFRLSALIIGGMHAKPPALNGDDIRRRARALRDSRLRLVRRSSDGHPHRPANDHRALAFATEALLDWQGAASGRLRGFDSPALVYCGSLDPVFDAAAQTARDLSGAEFLPLEGLSHTDSFERSALILPAVLNLLVRAGYDAPEPPG